MCARTYDCTFFGIFSARVLLLRHGAAPRLLTFITARAHIAGWSMWRLAPFFALVSNCTTLAL